MTYLFTSSLQHRADSLHATTYTSHYCYCVARSAAAWVQPRVALHLRMPKVKAHYSVDTSPERPENSYVSLARSNMYTATETRSQSTTGDLVTQFSGTVKRSEMTIIWWPLITAHKYFPVFRHRKFSNIFCRKYQNLDPSRIFSLCVQWITDSVCELNWIDNFA